MKVNIKQLSGVALDWAVAKCQDGFNADDWLHDHRLNFRTLYSSAWSQGGPIIERENITLIRANDTYGVDDKGYCNNVRSPCWFAECSKWVGHNVNTSYEHEHMDPTFMIDEASGQYGPTPLVAAMRCYVASKLGVDIDIPDDILDS